MVLHRLALMLAPWQALYSSSKTISASVTAVHLLTLLFAGGLAVAADRSTLRIARAGAGQLIHHLEELRAVHRPVLIALTLLCVSGVALAAADIETFAASPLFWLKLGLVFLLLGNGIVLARTEAALRRMASLDIAAREHHDRLWRRLRASAICSIALWST